MGEENKTEIVGGRKMTQDRFNAWIMILGLLLILAACVLESSIVSIAIGLAGVTIGGLAFKGDSFNRANAKEHQAKAGLIKSLLVFLFAFGALFATVSAVAEKTGTVGDGHALYWEPTAAEGITDWKTIEWQMEQYKTAKVSGDFAKARSFALWEAQKAWQYNNEVYALIQANHGKWKSQRQLAALVDLLAWGEEAATEETIKRYKKSAASALVKIESNRSYLREALKSFE